MKTKVLQLFLLAALLAMPATAADDAYSKYGKPRIMILISETVDDAESKSHSAEKQIEKYFLSLGFKIIDKTQMDQVKDRDKAMFVNDPAKAAALGARYGAELVIMGTAEAQFAILENYGGIPMNLYDANIDLKGVHTDLATVILVEDAAARKGSSGKLKAAKDALKEAGKTIAAKLEKQLQAKWSKQAGGANEISLVVNNIDFSGLGKLQPVLQGIKGVKGIQMRSMQNGTAIFDIELDGITIAGIRTAVAAVKDPDIRITGLSQNRIDARIGVEAVKTGAVDVKKGAGAPSLDIEEVALIDLFPSQYNYYNGHPIGKIRIKNNTGETYKKVKVSIFIPKYMELRSEQVIPELAGNTEKELDILVSLNNDEILKIDENTKTQAEVKLAYYEGDGEKVLDRIAPITIYDRNSIDWKQKNSVAAFVTPKDDVVKAFSRKAISTVDEKALTVNNRNLKNAIAIYDALSTLGIKYLSDPNTSFSERALDHVQYPRETLLYKTGDCDDTSVLLASCLESIGLTTGMIASTDHIFMMFDTGLMPRNALQLGFTADMFVERDGRLWIPVETTRLDKSFLAAWQLGIKEFTNLLAKSTAPEITPVRAAWKTYTSVALPEAVKAGSWSFPAADVYNAKVKSDAAEMVAAAAGTADALVQQLRYAVKKNETDLAIRNRLCAALVRTGQAATARKELDAALKMKGAKKNAALNNTMGNLLFTQNDFNGALKYYQIAVKAGAKDGGYTVNMGFASFALDKEEAAAGHFANGIKKFKDGPTAIAAMGFDVRDLNGYLDNLAAGGAVAGQRGSYIEDDEVNDAVTGTKTKKDGPVAVADASTAKKDAEAASRRNKMLDDALADLDFDVEEEQVGGAQFGGRRGADPTQIKNMKTLLYWNE